jgi:hypothetical protein
MLSAAAWLAGVVPAQAATRQMLAPIGGGYGQTVRLTIAAPAGARCATSAGLLLPAQPTPIEARELDLAPGQTAVVEVSVTRLLGRPGRRVELLPYVEPRVGSCLVSTEVFEQVTGRTMALSKAVIAGFDPQPDPPAPSEFGLLLPATGAAPGQLVRLGVARGFDPQPEPPAHCTAVLAFADARGAVVGRTLAVDLGEGEAATLDLDPSLLLPASPLLRRLIVQPRLLLPASGGGDTSGCVASLQLVDTATGWTTAMVSH